MKEIKAIIQPHMLDKVMEAICRTSSGSVSARRPAARTSAAVSSAAGRSPCSRRSPERPSAPRGRRDTTAISLRPRTVQPRTTLRRGLVGANPEGCRAVRHLRCGTVEGVQAVKRSEAATRILGKKGGRRDGSAAAQAGAYARLWILIKTINSLAANQRRLHRRSRGGFGSLPGGTVSESRIFPVCSLDRQFAAALVPHDVTRTTDRGRLRVIDGAEDRGGLERH